MTDWSLSKLLADLHDEIERKLHTARTSFGHPGTKGDASEGVWLEMLKAYLPQRYAADKAFVVDSNGAFSQQIDLVVYDRQYSPFIFRFGDEKVIPAESVYAVFEAKQAVNAEHIAYAAQKILSVRKLLRTSLPIPHAGGTFPPKPLIPILGGILTFESDWNPAFGEPLTKALDATGEPGRIDIGCIAAEGYFFRDGTTGKYDFHPKGKPATAFLLKLIAQLQFSGTVPMIDVQAYAKWLSPS